MWSEVALCQHRAYPHWPCSTGVKHPSPASCLAQPPAHNPLPGCLASCSQCQGRRSRLFQTPPPKLDSAFYIFDFLGQKKMFVWFREILSVYFPLISCSYLRQLVIARNWAGQVYRCGDPYVPPSVAFLATMPCHASDSLMPDARAFPGLLLSSA